MIGIGIPQCTATEAHDQSPSFKATVQTQHKQKSSWAWNAPSAWTIEGDRGAGAMILIENIKQWDAHALMTGERPTWWKRLLIRIFVGTKFPKKRAHA
jgi:hypothetical protein